MDPLTAGLETTYGRDMVHLSLRYTFISFYSIPSPPFSLFLPFSSTSLPLSLFPLAGFRMKFLLHRHHSAAAAAFAFCLPRRGKNVSSVPQESVSVAPPRDGAHLPCQARCQPSGYPRAPGQPIGPGPAPMPQRPDRGRTD